MKTSIMSDKLKLKILTNETLSDNTVVESSMAFSEPHSMHKSAVINNVMLNLHQLHVYIVTRNITLRNRNLQIYNTLKSKLDF
jgi:hypothetical protein